MQRCHCHRISWPSPSALGTPGQQPGARQCVYSQVPLIAGGDRTAVWPPWPAAPAKRQQLGTSARATCSPMCSLACWGHPGVPLAAGRASGLQMSYGRSQGVLCTSRGAPGHPSAVSSRRTAAAPGAEGTGVGVAQGIPELSAALCRSTDGAAEGCEVGATPATAPLTQCTCRAVPQPQCPMSLAGARCALGAGEGTGRPWSGSSLGSSSG